MFYTYIRRFCAQGPKMQVASRKKTISYADGDDDGNEEDSFKIRSGRRRRDEVTCGKFGRVYSHSEFVPSCILCISSGGSFHSSGSENQEITEKVERGNMCTNKEDREEGRERKGGGREGERRVRATKYYHLGRKVPRSKFRGN